MSASAESAIRVRRLARGDRRAVVDVFRGLSEASRRLRFHGPKPDLPEHDVSRLVDVGCCGREAVAAVDVASGRTIGIGRFVRDGESGTAEIAFSVVDEWQGRGVGTALLGELECLARREGIERFRATVSASNERALALVRRAGRVVSARLEDGAYELVVELA
jgi:RimJ/RimL family protein N-acetyltransferase